MTATTLDLDQLHLDKGAHQRLDDGACLLEAASVLAGEDWSDHPSCVSQVLGAAGRALNDAIVDQDERDALKALLPHMLNTAGDGHDPARKAMAWAWIVQVYTPTWLRRAGLEDAAAAVAAADPVAEGKKPVALTKASKEAAAAGAAAGAAVCRSGAPRDRV